MYLNSLHIFTETFTDGFNPSTLDIFSFISIVSAILVIISKNPILSVLYLISLFLAISAYLILIGLTFIGLSYLLVYVGAVSILFLFILMLINIRMSELLSETRNSIPLVLIVVFSFSIIFDSILSLNVSLNDNVFNTSSNNWDNTLIDSNHITSIGNIMYTNYSIWLIITSIILLLAMVGAIIITLNHKVSTDITYLNIDKETILEK